MPWWGWITVGTLLLAAEMSFVDLEFYLVFLGISALTVGALALFGVVMPAWLQWLVFAGLAVGSFVLFRKALYSKMRPPPEGEIPSGVDGEWAVSAEEIAPGATGQVTLRGTTWTGLNRGAVLIPAGARCRVARSEGLVLEIQLD